MTSEGQPDQPPTTAPHSPGGGFAPTGDYEYGQPPPPGYPYPPPPSDPVVPPEGAADAPERSAPGTDRAPAAPGPDRPDTTTGAAHPSDRVGYGEYPHGDSPHGDHPHGDAGQTADQHPWPTPPSDGGALSDAGRPPGTQGGPGAGGTDISWFEPAREPGAPGQDPARGSAAVPGPRSEAPPEPPEPPPGPRSTGPPPVTEPPAPAAPQVPPGAASPTPPPPGPAVGRFDDRSVRPDEPPAPGGGPYPPPPAASEPPPAPRAEPPPPPAAGAPPTGAAPPPAVPAPAPAPPPVPAEPPAGYRLSHPPEDEPTRPSRWHHPADPGPGAGPAAPDAPPPPGPPAAGADRGHDSGHDGGAARTRPAAEPVVRRAAAVPPASLATPDPGQSPPVPPQPRVYQTAAGPPQPVDTPPDRAASASDLPADPQQSDPAGPGGALPVRTPGEHAFPSPGAGNPLPQRTPDRAVGVPSAYPPPGPDGAAGTVAGTGAEVAGGNPAGLRPPRQRQPDSPAFDDPAPAGGPLAADPARPPGPWAEVPESAVGAPYPPAQPAGPPRPDPVPPAGPADRPPPAEPLAAATATPPAGRTPAAGPTPDGGPGGGAETAADDEPVGRSGPPTSAIVGVVLISATLLVLGALSVPLLLQWLRDSGSEDYQVGDCVVRSGQSAEDAACDAPGAYEIVAEVDSREKCGDPTQPVIEVTGPRFYCLDRVSADSTTGPVDPETGSPSAGDTGDPDTDDRADQQE